MLGYPEPSQRGIQYPPPKKKGQFRNKHGIICLHIAIHFGYHGPRIAWFFSCVLGSRWNFRKDFSTISCRRFLWIISNFSFRPPHTNTVQTNIFHREQWYGKPQFWRKVPILIACEILRQLSFPLPCHHTALLIEYLILTFGSFFSICEIQFMDCILMF